MKQADSDTPVGCVILTITDMIHYDLGHAISFLARVTRFADTIEAQT
jgi:hypothetical protein